jgi:antibiotic biosynthesis monooxygenase (ABM) superfamily enzyme
MMLVASRQERRAAERGREPPVIYVTQLIYVREGHEADFERFEAIVLPRLRSYSGELVLRIRPDPASKISGTAELPYEVHIIRFENDEDLARYSQDEERQRWLHLKDSSVRSALLIKGSSL